MVGTPSECSIRPKAHKNKVRRNTFTCCGAFFSISQLSERYDLAPTIKNPGYRAGIFSILQRLRMLDAACPGFRSRLLPGHPSSEGFARFAGYPDQSASVRAGPLGCLAGCPADRFVQFAGDSYPYRFP